MPDLTVTITAVEAGVLESYFISADEGAEHAIRRLVRVKAKELIYQSSSTLDPRKMTDAELRDELLVVASEIPSFCERPENVEHPDCLADSSSSGS